MFSDVRPAAVLIAVTALFTLPAAAHVTGTTQQEPPDYRPAPPSKPIDYGTPRPFCPDNATYTDWRKEQTVMGVHIMQSQACHPDNPKVVAAVTKGTNHMPDSWRMETGLSHDAVRKGADLDGDGDPDVINISLEVAELNGIPMAGATSSNRLNAFQEIAPGVSPPLWSFVPESFGMATEGGAASNIVRFPPPAIRVEQGDRIRVTLENTHYMPHTIHFHGVDHPFMHNGTGNDGVPQTSEVPVTPGEQRTYNFQPRSPGTFFYHCHVQPQAHVLMGLQGMFVVAEQRANNTVQTFNIGNGKLRHMSAATEERYDQVYDLQYNEIDKELHEIVTVANDPRIVSRTMNRRYDVTDRDPDYYLLNGRSFPFTMRESQIIVEQGQDIKLRVLNGGSEDVDLHTHGHTFEITHTDGRKVPEDAQLTRDVAKIGAAQRVDLHLNTTDDGHNSYGPGVWFVHSHKEAAVTTNGIAPGGSITTITYESFLKANGMPERHGVSWEPYFTERYYERQVPVWQGYAPLEFVGAVQELPPSNTIIALFGLVGLLVGALTGIWVMRG